MAEEKSTWWLKFLLFIEVYPQLLLSKATPHESCANSPVQEVPNAHIVPGEEATPHFVLKVKTVAQSQVWQEPVFVQLQVLVDCK